MKLWKLASAFMLAAIPMLSAFAQTNLGELLDMGAVKMGKEEWLSKLPASYSGISFSGKVKFRFDFEANGKFSGFVESTQGTASTGSFGTWTMDDNGKKCIDEKLTSWNMTWNECYYTFKLGDRIFASPSDIDRSAQIMARTISPMK